MNRQLWESIDTVVLLPLLVLALLAGVLMSNVVFERLPHLEDEATYRFQAQTYAAGLLCAPAALHPTAFSQPFVINFNGCRVGKYSIGWPLLLAAGERFRGGWLVNPVLGAALAALIYAVARQVGPRLPAFFAALMGIASPFFLAQAGSYMGHLTGAVLTAGALLAILRLEHALAGDTHWRGWALVLGGCLGWLVLARPYSALAVSVMLGIGALWLWWPHLPALRVPRLVAWVGVPAVLLAALHPLYLWAVTGSPFTNLYTLTWPYDRVGFGPGIGALGGHTLRQGLVTSLQGLRLWASDLFGLPGLSWLPVALGAAALRVSHRGRTGALVTLFCGPFVALVLAYAAYWVGAQVYGPRYYFEAHAGLAVLAGFGVWGGGRWLSRRITSPPNPLYAGGEGEQDQTAGNDSQQYGRWGEVAGVIVIALLLAINLTLYLPARLTGWHTLYSIDRTALAELDQTVGDGPAVVLVISSRWIEYAALNSVNTPLLDGPLIVAHSSRIITAAELAALVPDRAVWLYRDGRWTLYRGIDQP